MRLNEQLTRDIVCNMSYNTIKPYYISTNRYKYGNGWGGGAKKAGGGATTIMYNYFPCPSAPCPLRKIKPNCSKIK